MDLINPNGWVARTGQKWKLGVFALLILAAAAQMVALIAVVQGRSDIGLLVSSSHSAVDAELLFGIGAVAAGFAAIAWLAFAIRCPECRHSPGWFLIRTVKAGRWWVVLVNCERCPVCESQRNSREAQNR